MSSLIAQSAIGRLHHQPVMVAESHTMTMAQNLSRMASADDNDQIEYERKTIDAVCQAYGFDRNAQNKPYPFQNGVAVIPIHGTLINRFGSSWGYVTGYNYIQRMRNLAMADSDVELIVYDHCSGGGEVAGAFETAQGTFAARGTKPQIAVVDHASYSAAYMQAAAADKIYVTPTGGAGSIGVYTMHVDMSAMLEKWGLKVEIIHSGDHKVDGHPFAALPDDVRADIQARVDKTRTNFVNLVAEYRNLDAEAVRKTEGRCYDAETALTLGLIDGIATPTEAIQLMLNPLEDNTMSKEQTTQDNQKDENALRAEGAAAERQRIAGILGSDEAKERGSLANHIAFKTAMSVEDATGMLAAAPKDAPVATGTVEDAAKTDPLSSAMDKIEQPNITQDANNADANAEVNGLMGAFTMATGRKL